MRRRIPIAQVNDLTIKLQAEVTRGRMQLISWLNAWRDDTPKRVQWKTE
jgi:hypothetical protein